MCFLFFFNITLDIRSRVFSHLELTHVSKYIRNLFIRILWLIWKLFFTSIYTKWKYSFSFFLSVIFVNFFLAKRFTRCFHNICQQNVRIKTLLILLRCRHCNMTRPVLETYISSSGFSPSLQCYLSYVNQHSYDRLPRRKWLLFCHIIYLFSLTLLNRNSPRNASTHTLDMYIKGQHEKLF